MNAYNRLSASEKRRLREKVFCATSRLARLRSLSLTHQRFIATTRIEAPAPTTQDRMNMSVPNSGPT
jgi:hypothetical protein